MFAKKDKGNLNAKTENLWENLCTYRKDSAKQISKGYGYNLPQILNDLQTFPGVMSYSGHRSGTKGSGENKSAMKVLDTAILHLKECMVNLDKPRYSMK
ncbi:hypothetical protein Lgra_0559 [Legionella gratiana]|uniref:Uncharacterized protein n=1 Tax=Legionella gratiana TaxID=45066 RepID=A0A378J3W0_9GAMM|nr:hypothetical protein [Legionella gratiana]KTD14528.1 hypothetical protein Lgra_0559 [Legionella gratiana]STX41928.1 Uncharacterised protein [Legionella gratiana]